MNILAWLLDKPFYYQKIVKVNIFVFKRICINYLHKCIEYFFNYFNDKTLHWIYWKHYYLFMYVVYQCEHFLQTRGRHPPHFDKNGIFWGGGRSSPHHESNKKNTPAMFGSVSMDGCLVLLLIFQYFNFFQNLGPPSPPRLSLLKYFPFQNFKN